MVDLWRTKQDGSIWEGNHNVLFRVKSTCFGVDFAYFSIKPYPYQIKSLPLTRISK